MIWPVLSQASAQLCIICSSIFEGLDVMIVQGRSRNTKVPRCIQTCIFMGFLPQVELVVVKQAAPQSTQHPPLFHFSRWWNLLMLESSFRISQKEGFVVEMSPKLEISHFCVTRISFVELLNQSKASGQRYLFCLIEIIKFCANYRETLVCKFPDSPKCMICVRITLCAANRATSNFCSTDPQYWTDNLRSEYKILSPSRPFIILFPWSYHYPKTYCIGPWPCVLCLQIA